MKFASYSGYCLEGSGKWKWVNVPGSYFPFCNQLNFFFTKIQVVTSRKTFTNTVCTLARHKLLINIEVLIKKYINWL